MQGAGCWALLGQGKHSMACMDSMDGVVSEVPLAQSCQNPATCSMCVTWVGPGPDSPFIGPMGRQRGDIRGRNALDGPSIARGGGRGMLPGSPGSLGTNPILVTILDSVSRLFSHWPSAVAVQ